MKHDEGELPSFLSGHFIEPPILKEPALGPSKNPFSWIYIYTCHTHTYTHRVEMHIPVTGISIDPILPFSVLEEPLYCYTICYPIIFTSASVFFRISLTCGIM